MNTKIIKLDINKNLYETLKAKQGDIKSRFLLFNLLDNSLPFDLTDKKVRCYAVKPDGKEIFNDLIINDAKKGYCTLELSNQVIAAGGVVKMELVITKAEAKLSTIPFLLDVISSLNSTGAIESTNEFNALMNCLNSIDKYEKEFADKSGKLEQLYTPRLNKIDASLEDKANNDIVIKKGYGTLNDFDEETRRAIQGMTQGQVNAVLGKGNVMPENLNSEIINMIKGNNLITTTQSFTYTSSGLSKTYNCTNFIPVVKGDKIAINKNWCFVVLLDSAKNTISEVNLGSVPNPIYTIVDDNCTQIVISIRSTTIDYIKDGYIIVKGSLDNYISDKYKINNTLISNLDDSNINDNSLTINKLDSTFTEIEKGNNLYKYDLHQDNLAVKDINGATVISGNFTNYIPTVIGEKYCSSLYYTQFVHLDENKVYISQDTILNNPSVITAKGKYLLVKGNKDPNIKIVLGTNLNNVTNDRKVINKKLLPAFKGYKSRWEGKKWIVIGDSISVLASKNYHDFVANDLGMTVVNLSVSGRTLLDGIGWIDTMTNSYDLVTVLMGANDQGYNCGIGAWGDTDYASNNSFYARVTKIIEKLRDKNIKAQIIIATPIRRVGDTTSGQTNNSDGFMTNALNKTTKDYGDVIKDCCNRLGVHCLDLYENGLDPRRQDIRDNYFLSSKDGTHPNPLGQATFLAPKFRYCLEKIAPYEV